MRVSRLIAAPLLLGITLVGCESGTEPGEDEDRPLDPALVEAGKEIFRFDTFGNEPYWTDTLRLHEAIEGGVSPALALQVGL